MRGARKIAVDGRQYEYRTSRVFTVIRDSTNKVVAKVRNHSLVGVSPDAFERGQWKRSSDGEVRPKDVADFIRNGCR